MLGALVLLAVCACIHDYMEGRTKKEWLGLMNPDKETIACMDTEDMIVRTLLDKHIGELRAKNVQADFWARVARVPEPMLKEFDIAEKADYVTLRFIADKPADSVALRAQRMSVAELFALRNFLQRHIALGKYSMYLTASQTRALQMELETIAGRLLAIREMSAFDWYSNNRSSNSASEVALWTLYKGSPSPSSSLSNRQAEACRDILQLIIYDRQPVLYIRLYLSGIMQFCSLLGCRKQRIGEFVLDALIRTERFNLLSLFYGSTFGRTLHSFLRAKCDTKVPAERAYSYVRLLNYLVDRKTLLERELVECIMPCYWYNFGSGGIFDPQFYATNTSLRLTAWIWVAVITKGRLNADLGCHQLLLAEKLFNSYDGFARSNLLFNLAKTCNSRSLKALCRRIKDVAALSKASELCEKLESKEKAKAMRRVFCKRVDRLNK
ncbi:hypothetical protein PAPHI01_1074 [Pancytospora philotis]|nr:hypothetical protein PAPHI01_1074 [Pancytospora philotis]